MFKNYFKTAWRNLCRCKAFAIATPIAWYMHQWLQNYAYRINISLWLFTAGGLGAIIIALATISFQATKAAVQTL